MQIDCHFASKLKGKPMTRQIGNRCKAERFSRLRATGLIVAMLASTALTPLARAGSFPAVVDLGSLDGSNGFRLDGEIANAFSGRAVASAGDVNGDGFADLIVAHHTKEPIADAKPVRPMLFSESAPAFLPKLVFGP
jgi:hypothetical protein